MSGLYPGLPAFTLPFTGTELIPVDTGATSGINPETATLNQTALGAAGIGPVTAVTGTTSTTATITLNAAQANYWSVTLNATNQTVTISNPSPGQRVEIELVQGTGGSMTVGTWTSVTWPTNGTAPTLTTTAAKVDVVSLTWNATASKWRGSTKGLNFA